MHLCCKLMDACLLKVSELTINSISSGLIFLTETLVASVFGLGLSEKYFLWSQLRVSLGVSKSSDIRLIGSIGYGLYCLSGLSV
jgi:hypothetical protein